MYGFPQSGWLSNDPLAKRLPPKRYFQCTHTPWLQNHTWRPVLLSFVVYGFGVKYVGKGHDNHLIAAIREFYPVYEYKI